MASNSDTPPTGTAIPRPRRVELVGDVKLPRLDDAPSTPPPPSNPLLADIYALIDARLPPAIVERLSSTPPVAATPPRQSLAVRAAKKTPRWAAYGLSAIILIGQTIATAWLPEYRGPIVQAAKLIALGIAEAMREDDPSAQPELAP